jgi:hypothetical protein
VLAKIVVVLRFTEETEFATTNKVEIVDVCIFCVDIDVPVKLFAKRLFVDIETLDNVFAVIRFVDILFVDKFDVLKLPPNIEVTNKLPALILFTFITFVFTVLLTFKFDTSDVPSGSGNANVFNTPQLFTFLELSVTNPYGCVIESEEVPSTKNTDDIVLIKIVLPVET